MNHPRETSRSLANDLQDSLRQQVSLLEQIHRLAGGQVSLIDASEYESLLTLVEQRQQIVHELEVIDTRLRPLIEQLSPIMAELPSAILNEVQGSRMRITTLVQEIVAIDEEASVRLRRDRDHCRAALESLATTQRAQRTYRPEGSVAATFADAQG